MAIAHAHVLPARPLGGNEPVVLAGGLGALMASEMLPVLWHAGVNPVPPCIFHAVTGLPCPFCGGTRSFVAMAHGHVGIAMYLYPLGPLLFLGVIAAVLYCAFAIASGRRMHLNLSWRQRRNLIFAGLVLLALNWTAKLLFLGFGPLTY